MQSSGKSSVRKAIITAAGLGTRFLPQTKAMPKEMLPLNNKPIIQLVAEQLVAAGVEQIIIVTGQHKRSVENHFDRNFELEAKLESAGKTKELQEIIAIAHMADFIYVRQKNGYGNASPVLAAQKVIGDDPFFVVFPDDFFINDTGPNEYQQLLSVFDNNGSSVISLREVPKEEVSSYGVAEVFRKSNSRTLLLSGYVEKPSIKKAPSNFAVAGTYLLRPDIWPSIERQEKDASGEFSMPVALNNYAKEHALYGCLIKGEYHDTGTPKLYLKAVIDMALRDPQLRPVLKAYLKHTSKG